MPYRRIEAQNERSAPFIREQEQAAARRRAARNEPGSLNELLRALAQGFAFIGLRGRFGSDRPAKPAY